MRDPALLGRHQLVVSTPPGLDPHGRLADNLPCLRCGYNLRGLSPTSLCPECGHPVEDSIRGNLLHRANPAWVARLAQGVRWITFAIALTIAWAILGSHMPRSPLGEWLSTLVWLIILLVFLAGFWRITAPEPPGPGIPTPCPLRRLARFGVIGGFLFVPLANMLGLRAAKFSGTPTITPAGAGLMIAWLLIVAYAGQLAKRLPEDELARTTRFVMWCLAGCYVLFIPIATIWPLLQASFASLAPVVRPLSFVTLPLAILFLWSIKLIAFDYRAQLTRAAEAAMLFSIQEPAPEASPLPSDSAAGSQDADAQSPSR